MVETKSIGICIGAATLSAVEVRRDENDGLTVEPVYVEPHQGNPREALKSVLSRLGPNGDYKVAVTGRKFRHAVNLSSISEPEAVESALSYFNGKGRHYDAVISAGGETFLVYVLTEDGKISSIQTGNKCASGTGEFFIQQLRRIGLAPEDAVRCAVAEKPYRVSGRCSVFCKSDCTHATNKGVPKGRVAAGLCEMMAGKIIEIAGQIPKNDVMLVGGTARNSVMVEYLKKEFGRLTIPKEATYFEALGAALWALDNETAPLPEAERLFRRRGGSFSTLEPIGKYRDLVEFKEATKGTARPGDRCIIGLDVGSTTTKAVLLRCEDCKVLASVYLRTQGNPVQASRECYAVLAEQLGTLAEEVEVVGLGVTGSGRQIAGLHAMTEGIVNEIIAHAAAALFYDREVDTIFEIGGQDAKYTFIRKGVPSDYAMNDACSAGTGSFLEEAAKETMGLEMEQIGEIALKGQNPPNFNDQCAAFISSDIKTAFHEGAQTEDIVAGLVYSVCMNYSNRVKGNRPVGNKVFMQGGVCYNRAVPMAMAALTGKRIIVPPEPGLMGAFGVALEVKRKIELGLLEERPFSLKALKERTLAYETPFICRGGKEGCDRKCEISRIRIEGKIYPFGGACNLWYNRRFKVAVDTEGLNLVRRHEQLTFSEPQPAAAVDEGTDTGKTVGINKSFTTDFCFPLYRQFFADLGFRVVIPESPLQAGVDRKQAPFCYPAEIAHGFFLDLLERNTDYLFIPHVKGLYVGEDCGKSQTCPICQAEPYYLPVAFKDHETFRKLKESKRVFSPVVDFSGGLDGAEGAFIETAKSLGFGRARARRAFLHALEVQKKVIEEKKETGRRLLEELQDDRGKYGVVIFGRAYNAFASEANMGIPHKFASRGIPVVPVDFLPAEGEEVRDRMYWSTGRMILRGASFVKKHPQLFGCYITNFSCGPDSFLLEYFKDIMETKPFLILELDSHVADAGLETRIEAFLDVVRNYREIEKEGVGEVSKPAVRQAVYVGARKSVIDSRGREFPLDHPRVHLVFPSMGHFLLRTASAVFRSLGIRATALPPADEEVLRLGRGNTSCKECLPLLLTVGTLLKYLEERKTKDELLVYFMPTASGPCRFGQYSPYISQLLTRRGIEDVALFSIQAEKSYTGEWGNDVTLRLWAGIVVADIMNDIYSVLLTNARDKASALAVFNAQCDRIVEAMERSREFRYLKAVLSDVAERLREIPLVRRPEETPSVLITGEIYVRSDNLSRQFLVERLAEHGFTAKVSSVLEWVYYTDWCYRKGLSAERPGLKGKARLFLRHTWMRGYERTLKKIMSRSGLIPYRVEDLDEVIARASCFIRPDLTGEAVLTVGASLSEVLKHYCGVIAIGPFGCMPNRVAESILTREMGRDRERPSGRMSAGVRQLHDKVLELPFLAVESDGNPFPQIINAKLEVFVLQAARVHDLMSGSGEGKSQTR